MTDILQPGDSDAHAPIDPDPTAHRRHRARTAGAVVTLLGTETSGRLVDLVERANADAYERGFAERSGS